MLDRRKVTGVIASFAIMRIVFPVSRAWSTTLPSNIGTDPDFDGQIPDVRSILGTHPPHDAEERIARQILTGAPKKPTPFAVANYFLAIGKSEYGPGWTPYVSGWPERWNPVIVEFFQATHTKPLGDVTPWCAAFTNWCFQR